MNGLDQAQQSQVNTIRGRMESEWTNGTRPRFEEWVEGSTKLNFNSIVALIQAEIELRQRLGENPVASEYLERFPDLDSEIVEDLIRFPALPVQKTSQTLQLPNRFKSANLIGEGGLGQVWQVYDTHMNRNLALKVIKPIAHGHPLADIRLEREAMITGSLQHPGIPPIFDHGKLTNGAEFFSMKLVEGETLAQLLRDRSSMELPKLISIFSQIAQTVGYAHSQNVVHRDLKPHNVMVGRFGEVQVMDWGMGKRLGSNSLSESEANGSKFEHRERNEGFDDLGDDQFVDPLLTLTRTGEFVGTPAYMAPEQALGKVDEIDLSTDVFGLGALLFRMLTGKQIYGDADANSAIKRAAMGDLSFAFSELDELEVDNELTELCRDCLQPDQNRRPTDAAVVAERITAYQEGVENRLRKAELDQQAAEVRANEEVKRGKTFKRMLLLTLAVFTAGLAGVIWQWNKAEDASKLAAKNATDYQTAAEEAEQNAEKFRQAAIAATNNAKNYQEGLNVFTSAFQSANPQLGADTTMTATDVLKQAYETLVDSDMEDSGRMLLLQELGKGFRWTGEYDLAIDVTEESVKLHTEHYGAEHPQTLIEKNGLGIVYMLAGKYEKAAPLMERTFELNKKLRGLKHIETLRSMTNLSGVYNYVGQQKKALEMCKEVLPLSKELLGEKHPETLTMMNNLAQANKSVGNLGPAIALFEKTLDLNKEVRGDDHPETLNTMLNLADSYAKIGRFEKAVPMNEEMLALCIEKLGAEHPLALQAKGTLGYLYNHTDKSAKAVELLTSALESQRNKLGDKHPECMKTMMNLAIAYKNVNKFEESAATGEQALDLILEILGPDHPDTNTAMNNLAFTYFHMDRKEEAADLLRKCYEWQKRVRGKTHPGTLLGMNNLGVVLQGLGKFDESLALNQEKLEICLDTLGEDHFQTWMTMNNLSSVYVRLDKIQEAFAMDEKMLGYVNAKVGPHRREILYSLNGLMSVYEEAKEFKQALKLNQTALRISRELLGNEHPNTIRLMDAVSRGFRQTEQFEKAIPTMEEALDLHRTKLGEEKEITLRSMNELAHVFELVERVTDAERMLKDCLSVREKLHPDDWKTFDTRSQLGGVLLATGKVDKAAEILAAGFDGLEKNKNEIPPSIRTERLTRAVERLIRLAKTRENQNELKAWKARLADLVADD